MLTHMNIGALEHWADELDGGLFTSNEIESVNFTGAIAHTLLEVYATDWVLNSRRETVLASNPDQNTFAAIGEYFGLRFYQTGFILQISAYSENPTWEDVTNHIRALCSDPWAWQTYDLPANLDEWDRRLITAGLLSHDEALEIRARESQEMVKSKIMEMERRFDQQCISYQVMSIFEELGICDEDEGSLASVNIEEQDFLIIQDEQLTTIEVATKEADNMVVLAYTNNHGTISLDTYHPGDWEFLLHKQSLLSIARTRHQTLRGKVEWSYESMAKFHSYDQAVTTLNKSKNE